MIQTGAKRPIPQLVAATIALAALAQTLGCRATQPGGMFGPRGPAAPVVIESTASAPQIVAAVNQNTSRVHSYTAQNASFSTPGLPGLPILKGSILLERPRRFRLRAGTGLSGNEVDLGSNDQLFWLWAKRNEPPALYFARHDQHATSAAKQLLPIDPGWVVDALGLVTLDPAAVYQGPFPRKDGSLELRHATAGPDGPMQRVTVVDATHAWVVEQHVYDHTGALVASATADNFQFDPAQQVSLPRQVTIRVPSADLAFSISTGPVSINTPVANPDQQWSLPNLAGVPQVDLGRSDGLPGVGMPDMAAPGGFTPQPMTYPSQPMAPPVSQPIFTPQPYPSQTLAPQAAAVRTVQRLPFGGVELPPAGTSR